jgi:hypothetical protein
MLRRSSALPDLHAAEHDIVAAGETLTVRYLVEATHQVNLLGTTRPADGFTGTMSTSTTWPTG